MRVEKLVLQSGQELQVSGFNVITGGNGVGKTTLLLELWERMVEGSRRHWHWVNSLTYSSTDLGLDARLVLESLVRQWDGGNLYYFSRAAKNADGQVSVEGNLRFNEQDIDRFKKISEETDGEEGEFFGENRKFRRPFISLLDCESRLNFPSSTGVA